VLLKTEVEENGVEEAVVAVAGVPNTEADPKIEAGVEAEPNAGTGAAKGVVVAAVVVVVLEETGVMVVDPNKEVVLPKKLVDAGFVVAVVVVVGVEPKLSAEVVVVGVAVKSRRELTLVVIVDIAVTGVPSNDGLAVVVVGVAVVVVVVVTVVAGVPKAKLKGELEVVAGVVPKSFGDDAVDETVVVVGEGEEVVAVEVVDVMAGVVAGIEEPKREVALLVEPKANEVAPALGVPKENLGVVVRAAGVVAVVLLGVAAEETPLLVVGVENRVDPEKSVDFVDAGGAANNETPDAVVGVVKEDAENGFCPKREVLGVSS